MSNIFVQLVKELCEWFGVGMMECKKVLVENNGDIDVVIEWLCKNGLVKVDKKVDCVVVEGCIVVVQFVGKVVLVEVNCEIDFVIKNFDFVKFSDIVVMVVLEFGVVDIDVLKVVVFLGVSNVEEGVKVLIVIIGEKIEVCCMVCVEIDGVIGSYIYGGCIGVLVVLKGGFEELVKGVVMYVVVMNLQYIKVEDVLVEFVEKEKDIVLSQMIDKDKVKLVEILEKIIVGKINKIVFEVILFGQLYVLDINVIVGDVLKKDGVEVVLVVCLVVGEGIEKVQEDYVVEVVKVMQV